MPVRHCAYCGFEGPLTREHLWPKSLHDKKLKANGEVEHNFWLSNIDKHIKSEPTIKDVCQTCNNTTLSSLDSYASEMFDKYWVHMPRRHETVVFKFDYHKLKRWLLKLSYNFARANNSVDLIAYRPLLQYINGLSHELGRSVQLYVLLSYPQYIPESEKLDMLPTWPYLFWPDINRTGHMLFRANGTDQKILRSIHIRSYTFLLAFFAPGEKRSEIEYFINEFSSAHPSAILLRPSRPSVNLICNGIGAWDSFSQSRNKLVTGAPPI